MGELSDRMSKVLGEMKATWDPVKAVQEKLNNSLKKKIEHNVELKNQFENLENKFST